MADAQTLRHDSGARATWHLAQDLSAVSLCRRDLRKRVDVLGGASTEPLDADLAQRDVWAANTCEAVDHGALTEAEKWMLTRRRQDFKISIPTGLDQKVMTELGSKAIDRRCSVR